MWIFPLQFKQNFLMCCWRKSKCSSWYFSFFSNWTKQSDYRDNERYRYTIYNMYRLRYKITCTCRHTCTCNLSTHNKPVIGIFYSYHCTYDVSKMNDRVYRCTCTMYMYCTCTLAHTTTSCIPRLHERTCSSSGRETSSSSLRLEEPCTSGST